MARDGSSKKRKKEDTTTSTITTTTTTPWRCTRRPKTSNQAHNHAAGIVGMGVSYEEYCELPFTLHTLLVDEHNYITRKGFDSPHGYDCELSSRPARSVHHLPAQVTVKQVLQHYQRKRGGKDDENNNTDHSNNSSCCNTGKCSDIDDNNNNDDEINNINMKKEEKKNKQKRLVKKFCTGLALLFDDALPVCLLYPEERPQYDSFRLDKDWKWKRPCEIYGSTYLLRLLIRLPHLLVAEPKREMDGTYQDVSNHTLVTHLYISHNIMFVLFCLSRNKYMGNLCCCYC
jgi:hypothetical protein